MDWIRLHLFTSLVGLIPVGVIVALLYQSVKKATEATTTLIDHTPVWAHRLAFGALAAVVVWLGHAIGVDVTCPPDTNCLTQIDAPFLNALVKASIVFVTGLLAHTGAKAMGATSPPPK